MGIAVGVSLFYAALLFIVARGAPTITLPPLPKYPVFTAGQCVKRLGDTGIAHAPCASRDAFARVLTVYTGVPLGPNECPDPADSVVATGQFGGNLVCLRNLKGPHPSLPGRGGGALRVGDCVEDPGFLTETRCPRGAFKILARVARGSRCPSRTGVRVRDAKERLLCLGPPK